MAKARKKTTKQEAKEKKAKRQATFAKTPAKSAAKKSATVKKPAAKKAKDVAVNTPQNPKATKKVLHIHSGAYAAGKIHKAFQGEEWQEVRLDDKAAANPDILSAITDLQSIEDESYDAVFNAHSLPKIYFYQLEHTLKEWLRVLKEEGMLVLSVPDMRTAANYIARDKALMSLYDTPVGPVTPLDIVYGHRKLIGQGSEWHQHKMGFTPSMIGNMLREMGFSNINVTIEGFNIWAVGYKLPFDHPKRVEKVVVATASAQVSEDDLPEADAKPRTTAYQPDQHPGFIKKNMLSDELDIAPHIWRPTEL